MDFMTKWNTSSWCHCCFVFRFFVFFSGFFLGHANRPSNIGDGIHSENQEVMNQGKKMSVLVLLAAECGMWTKFSLNCKSQDWLAAGIHSLLQHHQMKVLSIHHTESILEPKINVLQWGKNVILIVQVIKYPITKYISNWMYIVL